MEEEVIVVEELPIKESVPEPQEQALEKEVILNRPQEQTLEEAETVEEGSTKEVFFFLSSFLTTGGQKKVVITMRGWVWIFQ